jgi:transposase-like protein
MGNTLDFMLSAKRDGKAAARFLGKVLKATHTQTPRVITVDKNAAYPVALETLKGDETLAAEMELRQSKYLNNVIEQNHRNIKRLTKPMMGFGSFNTALAFLERDRSHEYDSQRTSVRNQSRGQCKSSKVDRKTLWSCCLRKRD